LRGRFQDQEIARSNTVNSKTRLKEQDVYTPLPEEVMERRLGHDQNTYSSLPTMSDVSNGTFKNGDRRTTEIPRKYGGLPTFE